MKFRKKSNPDQIPKALEAEPRQSTPETKPKTGLKLPRTGQKPTGKLVSKSSKSKFSLRRKSPQEIKKKGAAGLYWRLILTGFLAVVFLVGFNFSHSQLKLLTEQIEQKRGQWVALSEKGTSINQLSLNLARVEKEIPLIEKALPNEREMIDFFKEIEKIEAETQVAIEIFSFDQEQPRPDVEGNYYLDFSIQSRGQTENLELFFRKLFNLPILMKAKTISFGQIDQPESQLIFLVRLYVDENFYNQPSQ